MKQETLIELEKQLKEKYSILTDRIERTAKHLYRREEPYSADFAEQAVEVENNEVVEHLDDEAKVELAQINSALQRLQDGDYGVCTNCQSEINEARLRVLPAAQLCIKCAEKSA